MLPSMDYETACDICTVVSASGKLEDHVTNDIIYTVQGPVYMPRKSHAAVIFSRLMLFPGGEAEFYDKIRWLLHEFEVADSFYECFMNRSRHLSSK